MSEWKEFKFGEIATVNMGQSPKSDTYNNEKIGLPFFQGNRTFGRLLPTVDTYCSSPIKIAEKNDILFSVRAPVGDINYSPEKVCIGRGLCSIRMKFGNQNFLFYLLSFVKQEIINKESGTVFGSVNKTILENLIVKVPDLPTQTAIAEILTSLDDKIELNNKINQELENLAQTLFKRWFVDFEFPNENGEPYKSSGGEMVDSELGEIPKGWEVTSLGSLLKLIIDYRGKTPLKLGMNWCEVGIKAISAKNVKSRSLTNLDNVHIGSQALYNIWMKDELMFGDVLLTSEAPLGETAILLQQHKFILSQRLFALRANEKISPYFLFEYLSSDTGGNELKRRQSGSTVVGIKQKELLQITLISPSTEIIKCHCELVSDIYKLIEKNYLENQQLTYLQNTLLPKLISGELEVQQVLSQTT
jgi:type I restriction enzyme S subunit